MGVSKTSDYIQIKIKIQTPSYESSESSQSQNQDFKDIDVLCTFKIKIKSQNLDHGWIKDQWPYLNQDEDANLKQTKYLIKAELFWANLRQTKYLLKAELLWTNPSWAELVKMPIFKLKFNFFKF